MAYFQIGSKKLKSRLKVQFAIQTIVTISHNLGYNPKVTIIDSDGYEFFASIQHINVNQIVVIFNKPKSGFVILN